MAAIIKEFYIWEREQEGEDVLGKSIKDREAKVSLSGNFLLFFLGLVVVVD